jgi:hypothetical protein
MSRLYERLASWGNADAHASSGHTGISNKEAIQAVNHIWKLGDQEGYWSERGRLAADAVWVAAGGAE